MVVKELCLSIQSFSIANESKVYMAIANEIKKILNAILVTKEQFSNYRWDAHPVRKAVSDLIKDLDECVLSQEFEKAIGFINETILRFSEFNALMQQEQSPRFIRALTKFAQLCNILIARIEELTVAADVSAAFSRLKNDSNVHLRGAV